VMAAAAAKRAHATQKPEVMAATAAKRA